MLCQEILQVFENLTLPDPVGAHWSCGQVLTQHRQCQWGPRDSDPQLSFILVRDRICLLFSNDLLLVLVRDHARFILPLYRLVKSAFKSSRELLVNSFS